MTSWVVGRGEYRRGSGRHDVQLSGYRALAPQPGSPSASSSSATGRSSPVIQSRPYSGMVTAERRRSDSDRHHATNAVGASPARARTRDRDTLSEDETVVPSFATIRRLSVESSEVLRRMGRAVAAISNLGARHVLLIWSHRKSQMRSDVPLRLRTADQKNGGRSFWGHCQMSCLTA